MKELTDQEFIKIRDYIKDNFGINLGNEKQSLVYSRLRSEVERKGLKDFTEYYDYLTRDKTGEAVVRFIDKITTNHTFFMREVDHFDFFRDVILPRIEQEHGGGKDVKLWCAGCSSGEEPYTLQMIMLDYFKNKPGTWNTQMLATDISATMLDKATAGVYADESVESLPANWRTNYFTKIKTGGYQVKDPVKKNILFRRLNLMDERFPFKKQMHVIFCRNVMIYFDNETRNKLVEKFYELTVPGGYLLIGHSESINHTGTKYKYVKPAIYHKD